MKNLSVCMSPRFFSMASMVAVLFITMACGPKEPIEFKYVKDVVVDATSDPMLRAEAVLHNPNNITMKLKKINVDVFLNGKKAAHINQDMKLSIPAGKDFAVPLEVKLAIKELGFLDTLLGMIGGKTMDVHYKGSLKVNYHGMPIRVPVDYKSEIRIKF